jgi:hypothetical protein
LVYHTGFLYREEFPMRCSTLPVVYFLGRKRAVAAMGLSKRVSAAIGPDATCRCLFLRVPSKGLVIDGMVTYSLSYDSIPLNQIKRRFDKVEFGSNVIDAYPG